MPPLGMPLVHAAATAAANQLHARTVLWPFGFQGLPGHVDCCSEGRNIIQKRIRIIRLCFLR